MKVTGTCYKCDVPMNPQESAIWKVLVGLIKLVKLIKLLGLVKLIGLVGLISLMIYPSFLKHLRS